MAAPSSRNNNSHRSSSTSNRHASSTTTSSLHASITPIAEEPSESSTVTSTTTGRISSTSFPLVSKVDDSLHNGNDAPTVSTGGGRSSRGSSSSSKSSSSSQREHEPNSHLRHYLQQQQHGSSGVDSRTSNNSLPRLSTSASTTTTTTTTNAPLTRAPESSSAITEEGRRRLQELTIDKLHFDRVGLLGRDAEIQQIGHFLNHLELGRSILLIRGHAGTGKSRLAEVALANAPQLKKQPSNNNSDDVVVPPPPMQRAQSQEQQQRLPTSPPHHALRRLSNQDYHATESALPSSTSVPAFCVRGKQDQQQADQPYAALAGCCAEYSRQVIDLCTPPEIAALKYQLQTELKSERHTLTSILPALVPLLGSPAPLPHQTSDRSTTRSSSRTTVHRRTRNHSNATHNTAGSNHTFWNLSSGGSSVLSFNTTDWDDLWHHGSGAGGGAPSSYLHAKLRFQNAFRRFVRVACQFAPLILVLDDLQWCDESTLELLESLLKDFENSRLLIVGTYRPVSTPSTATTTTTSRLSLRGGGGSNHHTSASVLTKLIQTLNRAPEMTPANGVHSLQLEIGNLSLPATTKWLEELLSTPAARVHPLAELVHHKTHGNAFFMVQFVTLLQQRQWLTYNLGSLSWTWHDVAQIQAQTVATDNVADLVRSHLEDALSPSLRHLLPLVASLGAQFAVHVLEMVVQHYDHYYATSREVEILNQVPLEEEQENQQERQRWRSRRLSLRVEDHELGSSIEAAWDEPPIAPTIEEEEDEATETTDLAHPEEFEDEQAPPSSPEKPSPTEDVDENDHGDDQADMPPSPAVQEILSVCIEEGLMEEAHGGSYRWIHDKVQEAALNLVAHDQLERMQYELALSLLDQMDAVQVQQAIFVLVHLLRTAHDRLDPHDPRRVLLAHLHLQAALQAFHGSAFYQAGEVCRAGIELLDGVANVDGWEINYELCLELYSTATEAYLCIGELDAMEEMAGAIIAHTHGKPLLDRRRAYNAQARALVANEQPGAAGDLLVQVLAQLGVRFPNTLGGTALIIWKLIRARKKAKAITAQLAKLPPISDETKEWTIFLLDYLSAAWYLTNHPLMPLAVFKGLECSLEAGVSEVTPQTTSMVGLLCTVGLEDAQAGKIYAQQAINLMNNMESKAYEAKMLFVIQDFVLHYSIPIEKTKKDLIRGYHSGMAQGDSEYGCWNMCGYLEQAFISGGLLEPFIRDCHEYTLEARGLRQMGCASVMALVWQLALNMAGMSEDPLVFTGEAMNEQEWLEHYETINWWGGLQLGRYQMHAAVFMGEFERAMALVLRHKIHQGAMKKYLPGLFAGCVVQFHSALAACSMARISKHRARYYRKLATKFGKQIKRWADKGDVNVTHQSALVQAELADLAGKKTEADKYFQQALLLAARRGFRQDRAMTHERFGDFFARQSDKESARHHYLQAIATYQEWGGRVIVERIRNQHYDLVVGPDDDFVSLNMSED